MFSEVSAIKFKNKPNQSIASHLNTYQGEPIRKSICQEFKVPPTLTQLDKHSHRLHTEANDKCSISTDMKKIIRQFRMPFKSNSPNLKKKNHP